MNPDELSQHVAGARAELDAAYRAGNSERAIEHLSRCALHLRAARPASGSAESLQIEWIRSFAPLHARSFAPSAHPAAPALDAAKCFNGLTVLGAEMSPPLHTGVTQPA